MAIAVDFSTQVRIAGLPEPETEFKFLAKRGFRFDWAWPAYLLAAELEGGVWSRGRHTRPLGYEKDCEKYSLAAIDGWCVVRFTSRQLADGTALAWVQKAFLARNLKLEDIPS